MNNKKYRKMYIYTVFVFCSPIVLQMIFYILEFITNINYYIMYHDIVIFVNIYCSGVDFWVKFIPALYF